jgi:hypothetical protein
MRRVYLSFLGLGQYNKESGVYAYKPAVYELNGKKSGQTEFVQVAELAFAGTACFDAVFIIATQLSYDVHYKALSDQLAEFGVYPMSIIIKEDMTSRGQWQWFESILARIEHGDRLTLDLTHGYRSSPIVLSAAVNFLQKARGISLEAVYYGVFEKVRELGYAPIIDMKDFYLINEWADGVSRLVEDADARKLAKVAEQTADFQLGELNDPALVKALESLTNTIRNVDVNSVARRATDAIRLITDKKKSASETGQILLDLVIDKFAALTISEPVSGKYDKVYFQIQLEIIQLLIEHKLYMQAYTVMREFLASIGMIEVPKVKVTNSDGRDRRKRFGEIFVNMLQYPEAKWAFGEKSAKINGRDMSQKDKDWDALLPFYRKLEEIGILNVLHPFVSDLVNYRNGFDHAWTAKLEAYADIEEKGKTFFFQLEKIVGVLAQKGVIR